MAGLDTHCDDVTHAAVDVAVVAAPVTAVVAVAAAAAAPADVVVVM